MWEGEGCPIRRGVDRLARSYPSGPDGEIEGVEAFHFTIIFTAHPHPHYPLPNAASPTILGGSNAQAPIPSAPTPTAPPC